MLEDFISPAAAERLRSGVLGDHVEAFCGRLVEMAYRPATIRDKLSTIGLLARRMAKRGNAVTDLDEGYIAAFVKARPVRCCTRRGLLRTGFMLLEHLRSAGVISMPKAACDSSPLAALLAQYEDYLRKQRAVTEGTNSAYVEVARTFVGERLGESGAGLESLSAGDVRDFQLAGVRRVSPKRAQYMGSALRSFLRFLFARGEISTDLALAVATVRQRRHSSVPRHMSPKDVERLLRSCNRSSATGRRNHAILLLLARLGLRASEVTALELGDLRWREGEIIVRGKGLIRDRVPLLPDVGEALALYLRTDRPQGASRYVFICQQAPYRGLGAPSTISTIVRRSLLRAGLAPATHGAHLLRHSLATTMVRRGASFAEIGQVLRHRSPSTTEIYAKLDFGALRDIAMPWPTRGGVR